MNVYKWVRSDVVSVVAIATILFAGSVFAADHVSGQVLGANAPIVKSTVVLWEARAIAPKKLAETKTDEQGRFEIRSTATHGSDTSLFLLATGGEPKAHAGSGDNPAIVLLAVLGNKPPAKVTINEFTTIASVWTNAQFLNGTTLQGHALGLRIAAGNVPNFVNLETGGYGVTIGDALNSTQSPTLANFGTLANVIAGCVTLVKSDACSSLFYAATAPTGDYPKDTLAAAENIARYPWYKPEVLFGLLNYLYPVPQGKSGMRPTPFMPYLTFAPSAWVLPLRFAGGGFYAGGKLMFDKEGNVWTADNFQVGAQAQDTVWAGGISKFSPNGTPLSPAFTGFTGGGLQGPGFGLTIAPDGKVWVASFAGSQTISVFDSSGKPLSPPEGYNFGGKLGRMQGIIATPSGDIWSADTMNSVLVHFPNGDPSKGEIVCKNPGNDPLKNPCKLVIPFGLAVDQRNNIWVTNILGDHVTRFPASDPTKAVEFKTGFSGSGLATDSLGNVWVTNKLGNSERGRMKMAEMAVAGKVNYDGDPDASARLTHAMVNAMYPQTPGKEGGSLTVLNSDGKEASFSPVYGKGITGPWAVSVDGNDNIWVANFSSASAGIVELCGFRPENCPPGVKTGDAISPSGGYVGGGLQLQVDIGIGPAGDVWVTNNWQDTASCYGTPVEGASTRCGGQGVVVFFGQAKPVRTPLIGPVRQP